MCRTSIQASHLSSTPDKDQDDHDYDDDGDQYVHHNHPACSPHEIYHHPDHDHDHHDHLGPDQVLTINVKPGWKSGTKITFQREGDQVSFLSSFGIKHHIIIV